MSRQNCSSAPSVVCAPIKRFEQIAALRGVAAKRVRIAIDAGFVMAQPSEIRSDDALIHG
jgi:hypothetical protein